MIKRPRTGFKVFSRGPFPVEFAFSVDPKAFKREARRLLGEGHEIPPFVIPQSQATTHTFVHHQCGDYMCVVCLDWDWAKRQEWPAVVALLAHEAVHVWQRVKDRIHEAAPGMEIEAYMIQYFTQCMLKELR